MGWGRITERGGEVCVSLPYYSIVTFITLNPVARTGSGLVHLCG